MMIVVIAGNTFIPPPLPLSLKKEIVGYSFWFIFYSDDDDDDDGESDDDENAAELLATLQRIRKERAEEKERQEQEKLEQEAAQRNEEAMTGNPLLNIGEQQNHDFSVKRR
jgi:hypothetical protein